MRCATSSLLEKKKVSGQMLYVWLTKLDNVLIPYAFVRSTKFSLSMRLFIISIGIGDPAAIPVLQGSVPNRWILKML